MREEERMILGWCVERAEVPACVAAVPGEAWSPDAEFLVRLLVELAGVDVPVGPLDLWTLAIQPVKGEIRAMLATWFSADDLLLLPQYAPWDVAEVEAVCGEVTTAHREAVWWVALLHGIEEAREQARIWWMVEASESLLPVNA